MLKADDFTVQLKQAGKQTKKKMLICCGSKNQALTQSYLTVREMEYTSFEQTMRIISCNQGLDKKETA